MELEKTSHRASQTALGFFARHFVAITVTYRVNAEGEIGPVRFAAYSGTLMFVLNTCCILTAGHVVEDIDEQLANPEIEILAFHLADTFGNGAVTERPIPFDFRSAARFAINDDELALDFGVIALHPHYVKLLSLHGMVALDEKNWAHQHKVAMSHHFVIGLPAELVSTTLDEAGSARVEMKIVPLREVGHAELSGPKYPRFCGKIIGDMSFESMRGMSGGPIIGLNQDASTYWIVAIQSSWSKESRLAFGCPLPVLGKMLTDWSRATLLRE